jgi:hypothetical protein
MPDLSTNFTGSGITTTSSGSTGDGSGGAYGDLFASLPPELVQLLKTKIATQQANANMSMRNAKNTEMRQGMGGVLGYGPRSLGEGGMPSAGSSPVPTPSDMIRQEQAKQAMLQTQAMESSQRASAAQPAVMPGKDKPYRLGSMLIDPTLGLDQSAYMQERNVGRGMLTGE